MIDVAHKIFKENNFSVHATFLPAHKIVRNAPFYKLQNF